MTTIINGNSLAALGWQIVQQSTKKRKVVSVLNVPDYTTEGQES
jgi:hypothetical protein